MKTSSGSRKRRGNKARAAIKKKLCPRALKNEVSRVCKEREQEEERKGEGGLYNSQLLLCECIYNTRNAWERAIAELAKKARLAHSPLRNGGLNIYRALRSGGANFQTPFWGFFLVKNESGFVSV